MANMEKYSYKQLEELELSWDWEDMVAAAMDW